jgi:hypothetical protein
MKRRHKLAIGALGLFAAMQLVRCERSNPAVTADVHAPDAVKSVLRKSCYDCHSNETVWPWYSHVAPVSWLLHRDVTEGRRHLNFSEWENYPAEKRAKKAKEIGEQVEEGEMPLWFYTPLHKGSKLTDGDKQVLKAWYSGMLPADK